MTLESNRKKELDDALLESLLRETFAANRDDGPQIKRVLAVLDHPGLSTNRPKSDRLWRQSWTRWASVALAACILIAAGYSITYMTTTNAAYAAVIRSLETTPTTRSYRIRMEHQRPIWGKREVVSELYLNDRDQFVVRHPGWSGFADVWIGGDADKRWIAPRFGPAYTGGEEIVGRWLARKDILSPYLHVSSVLERMSRFYHLRLLDNEFIPHATAPDVTSECQHIRGRLRPGNRSLPAQIELWADIETGMARRLVLTWGRSPSERGPVSWTIELTGAPTLPANWFELEGHISPDRKVISIQSTAELDAAERGTNESN